MSQSLNDEAASALVAGIETLSQHIEVLREAIDELRDEVVYELRRLRDAGLDGTRTPEPVRTPTAYCHLSANAGTSPVNDEDVDFPKFLERLQATRPALRLRSQDWEEDFQFPVGDIVEIDNEIWDWFGDYLPTVADGPGWFVAEDGDESYYVLWLCDGRRCLRMLNDAEAERFGFRSATDQPADGGPRAPAPPPPPIVQPTLW